MLLVASNFETLSCHDKSLWCMVHSSAAWFQRFRAMPLEDYAMTEMMLLN